MIHIGTQPLETGRLKLRRIEAGDAQSFFDMMNDERVTRFLLFPRLTEPKQAEDVIRRDLALYNNEPGFYLWVIEVKESSAFAGTISLSVASERSEVGEIGYSLRYEHWGRGYASEALGAVLAFGFGAVGFNRIEGKHSTQNPNSGKVMRKAGMLYEGMAREG